MKCTLSRVKTASKSVNKFLYNRLFFLTGNAADTEGPYYCDARNLVDAPQTQIFFGYYMPNSSEFALFH